MRFAFLTGLVSVLVLGPVRAWAQAGSIVGSWRGTSTCVDREHYPACKDEHVIFDARPLQGSRETVTVRADKVVDGTRELMSEDTFTLEPDGTWAAKITTPRVHLVLQLRLAGDRATGTLTDLDSGRRVRDIVLERVR